VCAEPGSDAVVGWSVGCGLENCAAGLMAGWFGEERSESGAVCVAVTSWWAFMLMVAQICTLLGLCVYLLSVLIPFMFAQSVPTTPPTHILNGSRHQTLHMMHRLAQQDSTGST
jgi:membrane protein implicated in regulation of membrane protease activity